MRGIREDGFGRHEFVYERRCVRCNPYYTRMYIYIVYDACTVLFFTLVAKLDGTQSFTAYASTSSMSTVCVCWLPPKGTGPLSHEEADALPGGRVISHGREKEIVNTGIGPMPKLTLGAPADPVDLDTKDETRDRDTKQGAQNPNRILRERVRYEHGRPSDFALGRDTPTPGRLKLSTPYTPITV